MSDRLSPEGRSRLMSRIRGKDTAPEMIVRRMLHGLGYRYVLHDKRLPGKPDLVFPGRRKVVFVHGCFWHGHTCGRGFRPAHNREFWAAKIPANQQRDQAQSDALVASGWQVLTVWECSTHAKLRAILQQQLIDFLGPPGRVRPSNDRCHG